MKRAMKAPAMKRVKAAPVMKRLAGAPAFKGASRLRKPLAPQAIIKSESFIIISKYSNVISRTHIQLIYKQKTQSKKFQGIKQNTYIHIICFLIICLEHLCARARARARLENREGFLRIFKDAEAMKSRVGSPGTKMGKKGTKSGASNLTRIVWPLSLQSTRPNGL